MFGRVTISKIKDSIVDLKNYVEIFSNQSVNKKNTNKPDGHKANEESIAKYSLLRYTEDLDKDCKKTANDKLRELNQVKETLSLTLHGNYNLHKGVITVYQNNMLNLDNSYIITNTEHTISGTTEVVRIGIKQLNVVA